MSLVNLASNLVTPDFAAVYLMRDSVMTEAERRMGRKFEGVVSSVRETPKEERINVLFKGCPGVDLPDGQTLDGDMMLSRLRDEDLTHTDNTKSSEAQPSSEDDRFEPLKVRYVRPSSRVTVEADATILIPFSNTIEASTNDNEIFRALGLSTALGCIPIAIIGVLTHFRKGYSSKAQRVWTMTWLVFGVYIGVLGKLFGSISVEAEAFGMAVLSAPAIGGLVVVAPMLVAYGSCSQLV
jgi:hypothetical protein